MYQQVKKIILRVNINFVCKIKNTYTTLHFGDFPKKKFFRNLREILLEDRRKKLESNLFFRS